MPEIVDHATLPGKGAFYNEELKTLVHHRKKIVGITQAELAKRMGFSRYYIILMEQGKINPERLIKYWKTQDL